MQSELEKAFDALSGKKRKYDKLWAYFEGDQPLKYSTERLQDLFKTIDVTFVENWCEVVINAVYDRITLERITVSNNSEASEVLERVMKRTELDLDADDVHLGALVCGESFVVAWRAEGEETEAYYHDPRLCHVEYDPDNPRKKLWAAKWWVDGTGVEARYRLNLYSMDAVEYYVSQKTPEHVKKAADFVEFQPAEVNPHGVVPVFHFRRDRRKVASELSVSVLSLQDAVNKLLADTMVTSEFAAITQRWIVTNADLSSIKNAQNEHWIIPAGDGQTEGTQVGQFPSAPVSGMLEAIDNLAAVIGAITRTPKHYFFRGGASDPSGESLMTQEGPLVKKVNRYLARFQNTWQRVGQFLLALEGVEVAEEDVHVVFAMPQTDQPQTQATTRKSSVEAGMPLVTLLRREGWSDEELEQLEEDRSAAEKQAMDSLAKSVATQQRKFDAGGQVQGEEESVVPMVPAGSAELEPPPAPGPKKIVPVTAHVRTRPLVPKPRRR